MANFETMSMITAFSSHPAAGRAYTVACGAEDTARDITENICSKYDLKVKPSQVKLHLLPACSLWAGQLEPGDSPSVGSDSGIASKLLSGRGSTTLFWNVGGSVQEERSCHQRLSEGTATALKSPIPSSYLTERESEYSASSDERTDSKVIESPASSLLPDSRTTTTTVAPIASRDYHQVLSPSAAIARDRTTDERVSETDFEDDRHSSVIAGEVGLPGLHLVCNRSVAPHTSCGPTALLHAGLQSIVSNSNDPIESKTEAADYGKEEVGQPSLQLTSPQQLLLEHSCFAEPHSYVHQDNFHLSDLSDRSYDCMALESESDAVAPVALLRKLGQEQSEPVVISSSEEDMHCRSANRRKSDKDCIVPHSLGGKHISARPASRVMEAEVAGNEDGSSNSEDINKPPDFSLVTDFPKLQLSNVEFVSPVARVKRDSENFEPPPLPAIRAGLICSTPSFSKPLDSGSHGGVGSERLLEQDSRIDEGIGLESEGSDEDVMIVGVEGGRVEIQDEQIISVLAAELQRSPSGSSWSLGKAMRRLRRVFGREVDRRQPLVSQKLKELKVSSPNLEEEPPCITRCGIKLTQEDLDTLQPHQWLNDQVINCYARLLMESSGRGQRVHIVNTFFYSKLLSAGYRGVERWIKKVDLFRLHLLLVPVHLGMHWCLAAVNFRSGKMEYFDPLGGKNRTCLKTLQLFVLTHARKNGHAFRKHWRKCYAKDIPHQKNGSDCGVFVCQFARWLCYCKGPHSGIPFSQRHMPGIRTAMLEELKRGKLVKFNFT